MSGIWFFWILISHLPCHTDPGPVHELDVGVLSATGIYIAWVDPEDGCVDNYTITVSSDDSVFTYAVDQGIDFLKVTNAIAGTTYNVTVVSNAGSESSAPATGRNTTCELFVVMLVFLFWMALEGCWRDPGLEGYH